MQVLSFSSPNDEFSWPKAAGDILWSILPETKLSCCRSHVHCSLKSNRMVDALMTFFLFFFQLQLIFVYVQMDNEDVGKPVSDYFGVSGSGPKVIFVYHSLEE